MLTGPINELRKQAGESYPVQLGALAATERNHVTRRKARLVVRSGNLEIMSSTGFARRRRMVPRSCRRDLRVSIVAVAQ